MIEIIKTQIMKIKKFKKELSVAIMESTLRENSYFLIELKQENNKIIPINQFSSKIFVKAIAKKLKLSDFFVASTFKFPIVIKVFNELNLVDSYLSTNSYKKDFSIVFVKLGLVIVKMTSLSLLSKLKHLNTFNSLDKLLNNSLLVLKVLNLSNR